VKIGLVDHMTLQMRREGWKDSCELCGGLLLWTLCSSNRMKVVYKGKDNFSKVN
jgi:hypothetical protein